MKTFLLLLFVGAISASPFAPVSRFGFNKPGISPRVTNGEDAAPGDFPYQLSYHWGLFGLLWQHVCGAVIISPNRALTAAHCVTEVPAIGDYKVIAGIANLNENSNQRQEIAVTGRIVHPQYAGGVAPNDIAVLVLASSFLFSNFIQPLVLPPAGAVPSGDAVLSGWGSTSLTEESNSPTQLQTVTIPIISYTECNSVIESSLAPGETNPLSEASNVCTGQAGHGKGACSGDSGGPLAQDGTIIGIVSWGFIPCGSPQAVSVFSKVSNFIDFINSN